MNPFTPNPPICIPSYSCKVISGPRLDLCAISDGTTSGIFSEITGNYEFYSTDLANYPAGQYTFEITGTLGTAGTPGAITKKITFVLNLVDPCPTTELTINSPFADQTYTLRDPLIDQPWDIGTIVTRATLVDCGPLTVNFFKDN